MQQPPARSSGVRFPARFSVHLRLEGAGWCTFPECSRASDQQPGCFLLAERQFSYGRVCPLLPGPTVLWFLQHCWAQFLSCGRSCTNTALNKHAVPGWKSRVMGRNALTASHAPQHLGAEGNDGTRRRNAPARCPRNAVGTNRRPSRDNEVASQSLTGSVSQAKGQDRRITRETAWEAGNVVLKTAVMSHSRRELASH